MRLQYQPCQYVLRIKRKLNANNALLPPPVCPIIGQYMLIERKMIDKSAILRGFRAMIGIDQRDAARLAGLSLRTVTNAESGYCSAKAWGKLIAVYDRAGLRLVAMPTLAGVNVPMIDIARDVDGLSDAIAPIGTSPQ
jgi:DNA-binding XRE family transcriptional regulator